jgi:hypothetical protein
LRSETILPNPDGEYAMRLASLVLVLTAASPAFAQSGKSDPPPVDFKPLVSPILPPLVLPPNSYISPGAVTGDPITPYSSTPGYDAARSGPAPGLRLTIPTR